MLKLWAERLEQVALLATLTVSNTADSGAGSLRQAILDADAAPGPQTITFAITADDSNNFTTRTTEQRGRSACRISP